MFGWQKPCYLLGEGYAKTFKELMESTDWDAYGVGNYEKCADCMVHSGFEATAVQDTFKHPIKALAVSLRGIKTDGEMAPEISLDGQRPAQFVFSRHVDQKTDRNSGEQGAQQASHGRVGFCPSICYCGPSSGRSTSSGNVGEAWGQPGLRITCLGDYEFTHV